MKVVKEGGLLFCVLIFSVNIEAKNLSPRLGLGIGWPYVSLKYVLTPKISIEIIGAFDKEIKCYGGRLYSNFASDNKGVIFAGMEGDYITFEDKDISGSGYMAYVFVGGEYFLLPRLSLHLDIGAAYVHIREDEFGFDIGKIGWLSNVGLMFYIL